MIYAPSRYAAYGQGIQIFDPCVILRPEVIRLGDGVRVDSFCKIEGGQGVTVGANVHLASYCHVNAGGGQVELGDHSGYASHCVIAGGATDYRRLNITPQDGGQALRTITRIGQYALIFAGAIILPGVLVGAGVVVAAGAVVRCNVPDLAIVAGVPARVVGWRDRRVACALYLALYPEDRYDEDIHHIIDDLNFEDHWLGTAGQTLADRLIDQPADEAQRAAWLRRYQFLRALINCPFPEGWEDDE